MRSIFCRAADALAVMVLFFAVGAPAQTNTLSDAEIQGRQLAQQLYEMKPAENYTNTGVFQIRTPKNKFEIRVIFEIATGGTNWTGFYYAYWSNRVESLIIAHWSDKTNSYFYHTNYHSPWYPGQQLPAPKITITFAGSDFWLCDLGLEFLHWPEQKALPKATPLKRGHEYTLLESTNPNPSTNSYSRVLTWIDKESGGILEAEAYDFNGKLLKDFAPKSFKQVNGQWQLQEMEIRNVQTGSRTRLKFDLKQ